MSHVYLDPTAPSDTGSGLSSDSPKRLWGSAQSLFAGGAGPGDRLFVMDGGLPDAIFITTTATSTTAPKFQVGVSGTGPASSQLIGVEAYLDPATGRVHRAVFVTASSTSNNAPNVVMGSQGGDSYQIFKNIVISSTCGGSFSLNGVGNVADGLEINKGGISPVGSGNVSSVDSFASTGCIIRRSKIGVPYPSTGFGAGGLDPLNWRGLQTDQSAFNLTIENVTFDGNDGLGPVGFGTKRATTTVRLRWCFFDRCAISGVSLDARNDAPSGNGPTDDVIIEESVFFRSTSQQVDAAIAITTLGWAIWLDHTTTAQKLDNITLRNLTMRGTRGIYRAGTAQSATSTAGGFPTYFGIYNIIADLANPPSTTFSGGALNHARWAPASSGWLTPSSQLVEGFNSFLVSTGGSQARFSVNNGNTELSLADWSSQSANPDLNGAQSGVDPVLVGPFTGTITPDMFQLRSSSPFWASSTAPGSADGTVGGAARTRGAFLSTDRLIGFYTTDAALAAGVSGLAILRIFR